MLYGSLGSVLLFGDRKDMHTFAACKGKFFLTNSKSNNTERFQKPKIKIVEHVKN